MNKPIFVWQKQKPIKRIDPEKVLYLKTTGNYTKLYFLPDKSFLIVRSSLFAALKKLPPDMFIRINDSMAVSVFYIDNIYRDHLEIAGGSESIGKPYYNLVLKQLNVIGKE